MQQQEHPARLRRDLEEKKALSEDVQEEIGRVHKRISHQQEDEEQTAVLQRLREEEIYRKEREKAQEEEIVRLVYSRKMPRVMILKCNLKA